MASFSDSQRDFFATKDDPDPLAGIDSERLPRHIAVIMDGNGRWAAGRGLPRVAGHRAGAKSVRELIAASIELGIDYLTIYSFSSENWNRPAEEVTGLMRLFVEVLERELGNLERMRVRVQVMGEIDELPPETAAAFRETVARTLDNRALTLVVALNYGGRAEIVRAVRRVAALAREGAMVPVDIDERTVADNLYLPDVPDPDLVIRTSGEMRVSNFLLWQIAYSEIWVTETLWPDFDRHHVLEAVSEFQSRSRRFGGVEGR